MDFGIDIITLLFFVAFIAGLIDAIAGGGGMITIPALMLTGMNPIQALSTNKLQATFGSFSAALYFFRKKMVDLNKMKLMIAMAFIGSILGGVTIKLIDPSILENIIPVLLICIGLYFLFAKNAGEVEKHQLISSTLYAFTFVLAIGFYDGFFGPGTGSLFAICFIYFMGHNISRATMETKVLNFTTNFASLLFFLFFGQIHFVIGIAMGIGQFLGAIVGAKLVISKGQKLIRPLIVVVSFAMSIKLLLS